MKQFVYLSTVALFLTGTVLAEVPEDFCVRSEKT